ncbi:C39 family peptidase [bacterium]|nr:C39 family peptidase [bacterium]
MKKIFYSFCALCVLLLMVTSCVVADSVCQNDTNLALGKSVSLTVVNNDGNLAYEGESSSDITDGSLAYIDPSQRQEDGCVGWKNSVSGRTMTVAVTIDLGVACNITAIRYNKGNTPSAGMAADTITTTLGKTSVNTGSSGAWTTHYAAAAVESSAVTITLTKTNTGTDSDWMFIGEIEVYGSVVVVPPPPVGTLLPVTFLGQHFSDAYCSDGGGGSCGPASLAMCAAYTLGRAPVVDDIKKVWSYIHGHPSTYDYSYECGNDMTGTSLTQLRNAARGWPFGLGNVSYVYISTLQTIWNELDAGRPMVVHVVCSHLSNRPYDWKGGHYVAVIGYDEDHIICHDPINSYGTQIYYDNDDMLAAILDDCSGTCNVGGLRYFYQ